LIIHKLSKFFSPFEREYTVVFHFFNRVLNICGDISTVVSTACGKLIHSSTSEIRIILLRKNVPDVHIPGRCEN